MRLPDSLTVVIGLIGILASVLYGLKASAIFGVKTAGKPQSWRVHQFWFNFVGSLFGWAGLWFLVRKAWICVVTGTPGKIDFGNGALVVFVLVGITGHLPYAIAGVLQGLTELARKVMKAEG